MTDMQNPATSDLDMAGYRARNAAASAADNDYIRRGELSSLIIAAAANSVMLRRDGLNSPSADIPFSSRTLTGIRDASAPQEPTSKAQLDAAVAALTAAYLAADAVIQASVNALVMGIRGESVMTRTGISTVGNIGTINNPSTGVFTWQVPAGIFRILVEIVGGGGGGLGDSGGYGGNGGASTIVSDGRGTLVTAAGGARGDGGTIAAGGAASGRVFAGGNGGPGTQAGNAASPYGPGGTGLELGGFAGFGDGGGSSYSGGPAGGGGAAGGRFVLTVVPGEILTFNVGAGGAGGSPSGSPGQPGRIYFLV